MLKTVLKAGVSNLSA